MSPDTLAGLAVAYALLLLVVAWIAELLPASREGRRSTGSPWARAEVTRFRKGMARIVRGVAVFVILVALVRLHDTKWLWPSLVVLGLVAVVETLSTWRAVRMRARRDGPRRAGADARREDGAGARGPQHGGRALGDEALMR